MLLLTVVFLSKPPVFRVRNRQDWQDDAGFRRALSSFSSSSLHTMGCRFSHSHLKSWDSKTCTISIPTFLEYPTYAFRSIRWPITHIMFQADIQTISWPEVVRRIQAIREDNPVTALSSTNHGNPSSSITAKLDAYDVANRIMREENYLIAIFNKDLLDLRIPLPFALRRLLNTNGEQGMTLNTALEHNLRICLMRYLFDNRGRVREVFLKDKDKNREALIIGYAIYRLENNKADKGNSLRHRFILMGILNAILAPFIVLYLLMYYFFRYFEVCRFTFTLLWFFSCS